MNIVFAGTPLFASRHLEVLLDSEFHISCVLTQPDRVSGRGKQIELSPVKQLSIKKGLDLLQPISLKENDIVTKIRNQKPDLIFVVAYGLIVPKEILEIPKLGCINVHGSLLPRWRGASPMEHAIMHGDEKTGLSYMKMTEGLDEGPVYEMHECNIESQDKLSNIERKLIGLSEKNLLTFLKKIEKKEIECIEQNHKVATFAPKIKKQELEINWENIHSSDLIKRVNALSEKYGVHTFLGDKRIKIHDVSEVDSNELSAPGEIKISDEGLIASCKNNSKVKINRLQMEGKNQVSSKEFLSAYIDIIEKCKNFSFKSQ